MHIFLFTIYTRHECLSLHSQAFYFGHRMAENSSIASTEADSDQRGVESFVDVLKHRKKEEEEEKKMKKKMKRYTTIEPTTTTTTTTVFVPPQPECQDIPEEEYLDFQLSAITPPDADDNLCCPDTYSTYGFQIYEVVQEVSPVDPDDPLFNSPRCEPKVPSCALSGNIEATIDLTQCEIIPAGSGGPGAGSVAL